MKKLLISLSAICFIPSVYAFYQCPGGTRFVNMGDSIQQVIAQCGKPLKKTSVKQEEKTKEVLQYNVNTSTMGYRGNQITFTLINGKVKTISTPNASSLSSITCLSGATVSVGASKQQVLRSCGSMVNVVSYPAQKPNPDDQITKLIYQAHSYLPKTVLTFKGGKLQSVGAE